MKRIDDGIDHIRLGAATALFDAIYLASRSLGHRQGRKVLVLITDGGDTVSKIDYQQALRAAEEAECIVYSIIVVPIENSAGRETGGEHALIQLSEDTGGKHYYATSMSQLDEAFHQISDELRTQYLLAYYPSQRTSYSQFRSIQVTVSGPADATSYRVSHRAGYYTSKSDFSIPAAPNHNRPNRVLNRITEPQVLFTCKLGKQNFLLQIEYTVFRIFCSCNGGPCHPPLGNKVGCNRLKNKDYHVEYPKYGKLAGKLL